MLFLTFIKHLLVCNEILIVLDINAQVRYLEMLDTEFAKPLASSLLLEQEIRIVLLTTGYVEYCTSNTFVFLTTTNESLRLDLTLIVVILFCELGMLLLLDLGDSCVTIAAQFFLYS